MRKILFAALAVSLLSTPVLAQALLRGWFAVNHTPAVNTLATASKAAETGTTYIATNCSGSISTVAAQPAITLSLRDGASGAGTVLWSQTITCAITTPCSLTSPFLNVPGTLSTAMTCEWSGIPAVGNFEVATLTAYKTR
jgi:hypothetical protein